MERQEGRRLFTWGLAMVLCLTLLMPCAALAAEGEPAPSQFVVTVDQASVYNEPTTSTGIVSTLNNGETFMGRIMGIGDTGAWIEVLDAQGEHIGYMPADQAQPAGQNVASRTKLVVSAYPYLDQVTPREVQTEEGRQREFVWNRYFAVTGNNVNVRAAPNLMSRSFTKYDKGTIVVVEGIHNGWGQIQWGGAPAYINQGYLKPIGASDWMALLTESVRIRVQDYVDLYFKGNYGTDTTTDTDYLMIGNASNPLFEEQQKDFLNYLLDAVDGQENPSLEADTRPWYQQANDGSAEDAVRALDDDE